MTGDFWSQSADGYRQVGAVAPCPLQLQQRADEVIE